MDFVDDSLPDDVKVMQLRDLLEVERKNTACERRLRIDTEDALAHLLEFVEDELDPNPDGDWAEYFVEREHQRIATDLQDRGDGSDEGETEAGEPA